MAEASAILLLIPALFVAGVVWFIVRLVRDRRKTVRIVIEADLAARGCKLLDVWLWPHVGHPRHLRYKVDFEDSSRSTWTVKCDVVLGSEAVVEWLGPVPDLAKGAGQAFDGADIKIR